MPISDKRHPAADQRAWKDVRILIVDEILFMKDKELKLLNNKLKEIRDRSKPFGGFSIIFAGDFRQLEPVQAKRSDSPANPADITRTASTHILS